MNNQHNYTRNNFQINQLLMKIGNFDKIIQLYHNYLLDWEFYVYDYYNNLINKSHLIMEERIAYLKISNNENPNIDDELSQSIELINAAHSERENIECQIKKHKIKTIQHWTNNNLDNQIFLSKFKKYHNFNQFSLKKLETQLLSTIYNSTYLDRKLNIIIEQENSLKNLIKNYELYVFRNNILTIESDDDNTYDYALHQSFDYKYNNLYTYDLNLILNYSKFQLMQNFKSDLHLKYLDFCTNILFVYYESHYNHHLDFNFKYMCVFNIVEKKIISEKLLYDNEKYNNFKFINTKIIYTINSNNVHLSKLIFMDFSLNILKIKSIGLLRGVNKRNFSYSPINNNDEIDYKNIIIMNWDYEIIKIILLQNESNKEPFFFDITDSIFLKNFKFQTINNNNVLQTPNSTITYDSQGVFINSFEFDITNAKLYLGPNSIYIHNNISNNIIHYNSKGIKIKTINICNNNKYLKKFLKDNFFNCTLINQYTFFCTKEYIENGILKSVNLFIYLPNFNKNYVY